MTHHSGRGDKTFATHVEGSSNNSWNELFSGRPIHSGSNYAIGLNISNVGITQPTSTLLNISVLVAAQLRFIFPF